VADRGFCGYAQIALFLAQKVQCLFRLHQARSADLRQGQRLGKQDRLVTWRKPTRKPPYLPNTLWKKIPAELTLRVLRFQLRVPGFRTESVTLVTTLTDARAYPAEEVARLYARRWRIELWFRDIKTSMGMEVLHCQSPRMVHSCSSSPTI
jgi:IS4 transposase